MVASTFITASLLLSSCSSVVQLPDDIRKYAATAQSFTDTVTNALTATPGVKPTSAPSSASASVAQKPSSPRISVPSEALPPTPTPIAAQDRQSYDAEERVLVNLYERVNPSVVFIEVGRGTTSGGSGSGFVVDKQGHIVTNNHVVNAADQVSVIFFDGSRATAKIVGRDPYADLAVIKVTVPEQRLVPVEIADSALVKPGQKVIALGNPFGLQSTMTTGIVSAIGRALPERGDSNDGSAFSNPDIIQTDAAINPGNSGGPLLDTRGRVVGVNTAIRTNNVQGGQASNSGVGFAVPSNTVKRIYPVLIEEGRYRYPYLGINMTDLNDTLAERFNLPVRRGVIVAGLVPGGPAEKAGLRGTRSQSNNSTNIAEIGDVIIALNGVSVKDPNDLISRLSSTTKPNDVASLIVIRDGKQQEIKIKLGERPR
jgi:2-alkenal reductase